MFYLDNNNPSIEKFDLSRFLSMDEYGAYDVLNSYMLYQIPKLPYAGTYQVDKEAGRPDNISYDIYGNTQYWWVVMWYNHILHPNAIKKGMVIKYPSRSSLEQLYLQASLNKKVLQ